MRRIALAALSMLAGAIAALASVGPPKERLLVGPAAAVSQAAMDAAVLLAQESPEFRDGLVKSKGLVTEDLVNLVLRLNEGKKPKAVESYRYLWIPEHDDTEEHHEWLAALQLHVNLLSRYSSMIRLQLVTPHLIRLDMDTPGWDRAIFEAFRDVEPYFHVRREIKEDARFLLFWPGGLDFRTAARKSPKDQNLPRVRPQSFQRSYYSEDVQAGKVFTLDGAWLPKEELLLLKAILHTEVPIVSAEWFLAQTCKQTTERNDPNPGFGYCDFLQLFDRTDFFALVGYDEKRAANLAKDVRAVQLLSGVSLAPRQIVRDVGDAGPVWVTLDVVDPTARGNALRQLKKGQLDHQIEEWYGLLANELHVTFLSNNLGARQNNAPADLAGFRDDSTLNESRDGRIHVNLACVRCHAGAVLRSINDATRRLFTNGVSLGDPDPKAAKELHRQYFGPLNKFISRDIAVYKDAYREATITRHFPQGLESQKAAEVYARAFHRYATDLVSVKTAARELGVTEAYLRKRLDFQLHELKLLDIRLRPLQAGESITRQDWEDVYELAAEMCKGYVPNLRKALP